MNRATLTMISTAVAGYFCLEMWAFPEHDLLLRHIARVKPQIYQLLNWSWALLMFAVPGICFFGIFTLMFQVTGWDIKKKYGLLPPFPKAKDSEQFHLVVGEVHDPLTGEPSENPWWFILPIWSLVTGVILFGATGCGKTRSGIYPFAEQIFSWRAKDARRKISGLLLEVKGGFCHQLKEILNMAGRKNDYFELNFAGELTYNPLSGEQGAFQLASSIALLMNQLFGKGKDPFWQQAYTNLVKFIILLYKTVDGDCTLLDVYLAAANNKLIAQKIAEGKELFATIASQMPEHDLTVRQNDLEAVEFWWKFRWTQLDVEMQSNIVEGITVNLSLFHHDLRLQKVFCQHKGSKAGKPLPAIKDLIETGKVLALNFPIAGDDGVTSRILSCLLKNQFKEAVLGRAEKMAANPKQHFREVCLIIDEAHELLTAGAADPGGDERFFNLSRQSKLIPIIATQGIPSLKACLPGETWKVVLMGFRNKFFMTCPDEETAQYASGLVGKDERELLSTSISESGQNMAIASGKAIADKPGVSINKSFGTQILPVFETRQLLRLSNSQALAIAYDGRDMIEPSIVCLKPCGAPKDMDYHEQRKRDLV